MFRSAAAVLAALALTGPCDITATHAAQTPIAPTRLEAWLAPAPADHGTFIVTRNVLLGAVAFNSPYLYGGAALHDNITCVACHGADGPSGPALRLTFDTPIPDLLTKDWEHDNRRPAMPEGFISTAIVHEFAGPPPGERMVKAMGAYLRGIEQARRLKTHVRFDAAMTAGLALALIRDGLSRNTPDDLDFLVDTARFALGQADAEATAGPHPDFKGMNRRLKTLGEQVTDTPPDGMAALDQALLAMQKDLLPGRTITLKDP
ncbi:hypothetical protein [Aestuariivirga sp.]|uniref:hypothetical protein n=1 Tax=Aestuariivirga sp. TaxID=2650926 RepID=UPI0039E3BF66